MAPKYATKCSRRLLCCWPRRKVGALFYGVCCLWILCLMSVVHFNSTRNPISMFISATSHINNNSSSSGSTTSGTIIHFANGKKNSGRLNVSQIFAKNFLFRFLPGEINVTTGNGTQSLPWCPDKPNIKENQFVLHLNTTTYKKLEAELGDVMENGGHYVPKKCRSREHLAIIIPYRDRQHNFHILLRNLLPFLWQQLIEFTVFLVEQTGEYRFNKGLLFNAAFREVGKHGNFTCYVMQDTDLIPMDNRNLYRCGERPRHLCLTVGQTEWKNKLPYSLSFGGAVALRRQHMEAANGFSVAYYGWGLEDDDLALRLQAKRIRIDRYPILVGRYYKLEHKKMPPNKKWDKLRASLRNRQKSEGLNTLNYTLVLTERKKLYTHLLIRTPRPPFSIYGNDTARPQL